MANLNDHRPEDLGDIRYCAKCGAGSHRADWKKLKTEEIFCDSCKPVAKPAGSASTSVAKPPAVAAVPPKVIPINK
jgi:hypothetical protein